MTNLSTSTRLLETSCYFAFIPQSEPHTGREATAPSIIIEIRKVQGREETPPDGGVVTPKDFLMKPS